jgi:ketosteroid isomerase-like protein
MRSRHFFVLGIALVALFFSSSTIAADKATPADAVRTADDEWMKVFSAGNLDKSVAFCDKDGAILAPNAPIAQGRESIAKLFSGFFALPNLSITWHADKAGVARSGELAYTSGTYQMTFTGPAGKIIPDNGKYVTVWKKQMDGSWKVLLDIFNTDRPLPGAP